MSKSKIKLSIGQSLMVNAPIVVPVSARITPKPLKDVRLKGDKNE